MFNGKIHYKWQFSIAMLVYQRVNGGFSIAMFDYRKVTFKNTKECNPE
jgi:hypothetical protein